MNGSNIKIGTRLGLAFGAVLLITAVIAGVGVWRLGTLKQAADVLATVEMERNSLAQRWNANINLNWVRTSAALQAADLAHVKALQQEMDATSKVIGELQGRLEPLVDDDKGKEILAAIGKAREAYRGPRSTLLKRKLAGEDVAVEVRTDLLPLATRYLAELDRLDQHMDAMLAKRQAETQQVARTGQWALAMGASLSLLMGLAFAWISTRAITRPIGQAVGSAQAISEGNLSDDIRVDGSDESAQMLQALMAMR
ncbi:MAG: MCP four helix bundle domain-containing protein, partial [Paucibacter sp.]|nr:MCP four helix bundle domain-containing protein [Roseateles sp.]